MLLKNLDGLTSRRLLMLRSLPIVIGEGTVIKNIDSSSEQGARRLKNCIMDDVDLD